MTIHESTGGRRDESSESLPGLTVVASVEEHNPPDV
jgi:hypothetical protein